MDLQLEQKLLRMIARHEQCLKRAARMLAADARGEPMPDDTEFNMQELKSLDANTSDLCVELLGYVPKTSDWMPPVAFAYHYGEHGKSGSDPMSWLKSFEQGLRLSRRFFESCLTQAHGEVHVGDKITIEGGSAHVVMTGHASARDVRTHGAENQDSTSAAGLNQIAEELATLRKTLRQANPNDDLERDTDIGAVASAEKAARDGDHDGMIAHLKTVGEWVLQTASKIGVELASAALKSASGLSI